MPLVQAQGHKGPSGLPVLPAGCPCRTMTLVGLGPSLSPYSGAWRLEGLRCGWQLTGQRRAKSTQTTKEGQAGVSVVLLILPRFHLPKSHGTRAVIAIRDHSLLAPMKSNVRSNDAVQGRNALHSRGRCRRKGSLDQCSNEHCQRHDVVGPWGKSSRCIETRSGAAPITDEQEIAGLCLAHRSPMACLSLAVTLPVQGGRVLISHLSPICCLYIAATLPIHARVRFDIPSLAYLWPITRPDHADSGWQRSDIPFLTHPLPGYRLSVAHSRVQGVKSPVLRGMLQVRLRLGWNGPF